MNRIKPYDQEVERQVKLLEARHRLTLTDENRKLIWNKVALQVNEPLRLLTTLFENFRDDLAAAPTEYFDDVIRAQALIQMEASDPARHYAGRIASVKPEETAFSRSASGRGRT